MRISLSLIMLLLLSCAEASPQGKIPGGEVPEQIQRCRQESKKAKKMADCLTVFLRDRKEMKHRGIDWRQPPIAVYLAESNCTSKLPAKK